MDACLAVADVDPSPEGTALDAELHRAAGGSLRRIAGGVDEVGGILLESLGGVLRPLDSGACRSFHIAFGELLCDLTEGTEKCVESLTAHGWLPRVQRRGRAVIRPGVSSARLLTSWCARFGFAGASSLSSAPVTRGRVRDGVSSSAALVCVGTVRSGVTLVVGVSSSIGRIPAGTRSAGATLVVGVSSSSRAATTSARRTMAAARSGGLSACSAISPPSAPGVSSPGEPTPTKTRSPPISCVTPMWASSPPRLPPMVVDVGVSVPLEQAGPERELAAVVVPLGVKAGLATDRPATDGKFAGSPELGPAVGDRVEDTLEVDAVLVVAEVKGGSDPASRRRRHADDVTDRFGHVLPGVGQVGTDFLDGLGRGRSAPSRSPSASSPNTSPVPSAALSPASKRPGRSHRCRTWCSSPGN